VTDIGTTPRRSVGRGKYPRPSNAGRDMAAGCYVGGESFSPVSGFFAGAACEAVTVGRGGLLMLEIMPVATARVARPSYLICRAPSSHDFIMHLG